MGRLGKILLGWRIETSFTFEVTRGSATARVAPAFYVRISKLAAQGVKSQRRQCAHQISGMQRAVVQYAIKWILQHGPRWMRSEFTAVPALQMHQRIVVVPTLGQLLAKYFLTLFHA